MHKTIATHLQIDNEFEGKRQSHCSLPVIHAHTKHNSPPEGSSGSEGKVRGIGHFQSYTHTQNTNHMLKFIINWEEKGEALIGHLQLYMHACMIASDQCLSPSPFNPLSISVGELCHRKHNSLTEIDNGLEGKRKRHWSLPVIYAHTKHNSPAEVDN